MKSFAIVGTWPTLISFFHGISAVTEEGVQKTASAISINDRIFGKTPFFIGLILFGLSSEKKSDFSNQTAKRFHFALATKKALQPLFTSATFSNPKGPKGPPMKYSWAWMPKTLLCLLKGAEGEDCEISRRKKSCFVQYWNANIYSSTKPCKSKNWMWKKKTHFSSFYYVEKVKNRCLPLTSFQIHYSYRSVRYFYVSHYFQTRGLLLLLSGMVPFIKILS